MPADREACAGEGKDAMAKRILIADDEPNIVVSLEFLMKQRGYDIRVVSDGAEALEAVGRVSPRI